jgi:hypothetical protein
MDHFIGLLLKTMSCHKKEKEMKKVLFILAILALISFSNQQYSFATVIGDGWMEWHLPGTAQFNPANVAANAFQNDLNGIILGTYTSVADPLSVTLTDGYSNISASIDQNQKPQVNLSVVSMNQGDMDYQGNGSVGVGQYIYYAGVLSNLDYSYYFHGKNDSLRDNLGFVVQIAASYTVWNDEKPESVYAYSDYTGIDTIPNYFTVRNNTSEVSFSGSFSKNLEEYGSHNWFIEYNIGIYGNDT